MLVVSLPVAFTLIGLLLFAICSEQTPAQKAARVGEIMFFAGLLVALLAGVLIANALGAHPLRLL